MGKEDYPIFNFNEPGHVRTAKAIIDGLKGKGLCRIRFERLRDQKTLSQVAYIWGVCYPYLARGLTDAWGEAYDSDRAHAVMKREHLSFPVVNRNTGEVVTYEIRSLADLTKEECSEYIEKLIATGAMLGVEIPPAAHYETGATR